MSADSLASLWSDAGLPDAALARLTLEGDEPAAPSSFALGTLLRCALGAAARASTEGGATRGATPARVSGAARDVVRESAARFTLDGRTPEIWDKLSGLYRCGAEVGAPGWVRIHANFAHHRDAALALLGLPSGAGIEREAVARALGRWRAEDFEQVAAERDAVVAAVRSPEQWQAHAQAAAVAALPLVQMTRIGEASAPASASASASASTSPTAATSDAPPQPWPQGATTLRPLKGLRVLDLTRILAGPVAGRTLAAYGADVMLVNSPGLPNIENIAETSRGKLSACIDLRSEAGRDTLRALVRECDVFLQAYRPYALEALGFGPEALAALRPGLVCLSLSAYGHHGPWAARRGFDSLVQSATGLNVAEAQAFGREEPRALPLQALDYGAGFLLAFGAAAALLRQRREGGAWHVRVALARVGHWLQSLGHVADGPQAPRPDFEGALEEVASGFGRLGAVRHAARLDGQVPQWHRPSMPPGTHEPRWPAR